MRYVFMYCKIVYKKWYQGIKINNTIYLMTRYDYYIWISLFLFVRCAHGIKSFTRYSQKLKVNVVLSLPDIPSIKQSTLFYSYLILFTLHSQCYYTVAQYSLLIHSQRCFTITWYSLQVRCFTITKYLKYLVIIILLIIFSAYKAAYVVFMW